MSVVAVAASGNVRSSSTPQKTAFRGHPHVQVPGGSKQKSWLSSWPHPSSTPPKPCPKDRKRPISGVEGTRARALVFLSPLLLIPGREYLHGDNMGSLHSESYLCSVFVPLSFFFFFSRLTFCRRVESPNRKVTLQKARVFLNLVNLYWNWFLNFLSTHTFSRCTPATSAHWAGIRHSCIFLSGPFASCQWLFSSVT